MTPFNMPYFQRADKMTLSTIKVGDYLCWQHRNADELKDFAKSPEQLARIVKVTAVFERYIKTDDGDYFIHNGCNVDAACGCNRFCNCWGKVEPLFKDA
jgi:hypothetical protein